MKILLRYLLPCLILIPALVQAQLTQSIKGVVTDGDSKKPLAGVTVNLVGSQLGAITNTDGYYEINQAPIGRQSLRFSLMGYESRNVFEIMVSSGKQTEINVSLTESVQKLQEVTVKSNRNRTKALNEFATASARQFSVEETKRYAAAAFDPARMVQNFAGVSSNGDMGNEIVVRGNSPKGILWRLDGIEIPSPNHFGSLGTSGGAISMLSSSTLGSSDFYTGAFPAEIGNAVSGAFDLSFREGNKNKREHAIMIGGLGIEAAAEGPFKKGGNATYLVNYRYSTLALLKGFLGNLGGVLPDYQDLSFKLSVPTKKAGTFQLFGLFGANKSIKNPEKDSTKWNDDNPNFMLDARGETGIVGLSHQYFFNSKSFLKTIVSFSGTNYKSNYDTLNPAANYIAVPAGRANQQDRAYRVSVLYNNKINAGNTLRAGVIMSRLTYDFMDRFYDETDKVWKTLFNNAGNTNYLQWYVQWKHKFNNAVSITTGLHGSDWSLNQTASIEPRAAITWQAGRGQVFTLAAGMHAKPEHLSTYVFDGQAANTGTGTKNRNLEMMKAFHMVAGYEKNLDAGWKLKAEAYFQHLYDVPVEQGVGSHFSMLNASSVYDLIDIGKLVNEGTGRNYGLDLTIEKPFSRNYYVLFTGSVFRSTYTTFDNKRFNTRFDRGYQSNLVAGKEWPVGRNKKNIFALNGKILTSGGLRQSPIDLPASQAAGKVRYLRDRYFSETGPVYYRFDAGISYKINRKHATHTFMLDIQNLTNHQNLFFDWYDNNSKSVKRVYQMGLFPIVNYRIEF